MKKIYLLLFIIPSVFSGCSKDFLKPYESRIVGNWHISAVNSVGLGGDFNELPFRQGDFSFHRDGTLVYTDAAGNLLNGYWEIEKRNIESHTQRTLHVTVVDFTTQIIRSEFYDEMDFRSTNHFVGKISRVLHTYVTHFRR